MSNIDTYLAKIMSAVYGEEVRGSIHDAIEECYTVATGDAGIPDAVKSALLACFEKVAWIDGSGQDYYDALETALNGGDVPPEPGPEYVWRYTPADGLLSAQSYTTKTQTVDYSGEEYINGGTLILVDINHGEGASSVNTGYRFTDSHTSNGRLKARFKCEKPYTAIQSNTNDAMGIQFCLSNGTSGCRVSINTIQNGDGKLRAVWKEGEGTPHVVNTGLSADEYHTIELTIDGNRQIIKIDDTVIVDNNGLNIAYATGTMIMQQVRGTNTTGIPYQGVETHFDWIEYYDDEE